MKIIKKIEYLRGYIDAISDYAICRIDLRSAHEKKLLEAELADKKAELKKLLKPLDGDL